MDSFLSGSKVFSPETILIRNSFVFSFEIIPISFVRQTNFFFSSLFMAEISLFATFKSASSVTVIPANDCFMFSAKLLQSECFQSIDGLFKAAVISVGSKKKSWPSLTASSFFYELYNSISWFIITVISSSEGFTSDCCVVLI